jgi:hypothetical protein
VALKASIATGNFTAAGTWGVVDATLFLNSELNTTALTTAYVASAGLTPGAITISHIGVKLSVRTGTTGTMSVHLAIATVEVVGTLVVIDTADLSVAATADINGGWVFFKLAAPVLLLAATAYTVEAKTSSAAQVSLFRDGTANNWSRCVVTTTTGAPAAADDFIIGREYTGQGTGNSFIVTYDETAATDYGSTPTAANSLIGPGFAIVAGGTLLIGTAATTAYRLRLSNSIVIYSGGLLSEASVATPMPRDSSFFGTLDCGANVDYGIIVRNLGTYIRQGQSRTVSKLIDRCLFNTDEAINSTSLDVGTDTGWLDNDEIAVASTTTTNSQSEAGLMNGAAGASTLTVDGFAGAGGGLAFAHSGTSPTQAEVILLTRNVRWEGVSATIQGYVDIRATATVDWDWAELKWMGSATANKRGVDVATTTGSVNIQFCALHDFVVASSLGINMLAVSGSGLTFSNNVCWNIAGEHFINVGTSGTMIVDFNIFMKNITANRQIVQLADVGITFTNNVMISGTQDGVRLTEVAGSVLGTYSGNNCHSNLTIGFHISTGLIGTVSSLKSWRNAGCGLQLVGGDLDFATSSEMFGNSGMNINLALGGGIYRFDGLVSSGDTTFSTTDGIRFTASGGAVMSFFNSTFGVVSGIKAAHTRDFLVPIGCFIDLRLNKTTLASATEISTQANMTPNSIVSSQDHDQTPGLHKTYFKTGTLVIDTVIFDTTPSLRITPTIATDKCKVKVGSVNLNSGQVATPTLKVRESVAGDGTDYNGNRIRLLVLQNNAMGITADTVLATATIASEGAFQSISAAAAAAAEDGVLEFAVDCDGTTGWINADTLTVAVV